MFKLRTSFRYAFSKTRGQRATSIMILVGIAIGLVALLVISAVMNGLQTAQLDQLRNLESFDVIVKSSEADVDELSKIDGVETAFRFLETNVLVVDKTSGNSTSSRMRAYEQDVFHSPRMSQSLFLLTAEPDVFDGIYVSYSMMGALSLSYRDDIRVTFLKPGKTATIVPYTTALGVDAFYSSRMTEFSSSTVFMEFEALKSIIGEDGIQVGLYVNGNQKKVVNQINAMYPDAEVITWQQYNKALYSALMLEKTLMYVFLAFMFLIICVNLKNSTRRLLSNKQKEGAMLRAIGCSKSDVNRIFLGQGLIICILGEILGVVLGMLVIHNIQTILSFVDQVIYAITGSKTVLALIPFNAVIGPLEIMAVCLFIFALSFLFTFLGCRKIYKSEIMEVILHASY